MSFIAPILRPLIRKGLGYVYHGLRQQDRIIDYTYRKTGLYNRGIVRGIKHGLADGQIVGGIATLGLNAPDTPGNDVGIPFQKRPKFKTYKQNKTRRRFTARCPPRSTKQYFPRKYY